ncbi:hypothetical protein BZA05DRAFT_83211 [Tricharina praecox]|uniref:uncharacterized protein n=1 Tax=Tricharina praecox TaxID=43433 RepID=UPI00221E94A3|nr:uncharacterized protein BZA05DRAFT_83211 [Tricharina praecox]KAI5849118.1 hypothetical protein BZA05DRAFT_83211 [Tricharina praecox]
MSILLNNQRRLLLLLHLRPAGVRPPLHNANANVNANASSSPLLSLAAAGSRAYSGGPRPKAWKLARFKKKEDKAALPKKQSFALLRRGGPPGPPGPPAERFSAGLSRPPPRSPPPRDSAPKLPKPSTKPKSAAATTRHFTAPHKKKLVRAGTPLSRMRDDPSTIIVHTAGVCAAKDMGFAAVGVWFGPESPLNHARLLNSPQHAEDAGDVMTVLQPAKHWGEQLRRAQICAAIVGLRTLEKHAPEERSVLVAVDQYLWKVMTDLVYAWRKNGWVEDTGNRVENWVLLRELDKTAYEMEAAGWRVRFWGLLKTKNQQAEDMAKGVVEDAKAKPKAKDMAQTKTEDIGTDAEIDSKWLVKAAAERM